MSMLAGAIADVLAETGSDQAAMAAWWNAPRRELAGLSPHDALAAPGSGPTVLALARCDVAAAAAADALAASFIRGWEGTD